MRKIFLFAAAAFCSVVTINATEGALNGKFSVSADKQVVFSKGNLQATTADLGANWAWGFAEHQYDVIGAATANNTISGDKTVSSNGTIDLFGWSTATTYYGINNSTTSSDYSGDFVDWGATIGEGWYTLSKDEWVYLFLGRTDAAHLFGMGSVNGVNGTILLPDNWEGDKFTDTDNGLVNKGTYYSNNSGTNYSFHTFTAEQWGPMEQAGAVFLPTAGYRPSADVSNVGAGGYYWSATPYNENYGYFLYFSSSNLNPQNSYYRNHGRSVRLVQDCSGATAIGNTAADTKTTKRIVNGQLLIEKNGRTFNALGAEVK